MQISQCPMDGVVVIRKTDQHIAVYLISDTAGGRGQNIGGNALVNCHLCNDGRPGCENAVEHYAENAFSFDDR